MFNKFDDNFGSSIKQVDWSKEKLNKFNKNFYKVSERFSAHPSFLRSIPSQQLNLWRR